MTIMENLNEVIHCLLRFNGYTEKELAKIVGVHQSEFSATE